jgi:hypothetical protein
MVDTPFEIKLLQKLGNLIAKNKATERKALADFRKRFTLNSDVDDKD